MVHICLLSIQRLSLVHQDKYASFFSLIPSLFSLILYYKTWSGFVAQAGLKLMIPPASAPQSQVCTLCPAHLLLLTPFPTLLTFLGDLCSCDLCQMLTFQFQCIVDLLWPLWCFSRLGGCRGLSGRERTYEGQITWPHHSICRWSTWRMS